MDYSGNENHAWASCSQGESAPGRGGVGNSLYLTNSKYLVIPNSPLYSTSSFSLQVWLFWISNQAESTWCPLLQKGKDAGASSTSSPSSFERAPAIMLNSQTSQVEVLLSTSSSPPVPEPLILGREAPGERTPHPPSLDSAHSHTGSIDSEFILERHPRLYHQHLRHRHDQLLSPLRGQLPLLRPHLLQLPVSTSAHCSYFDEIKWFSRALSASELQA